MAEEQQHKTSIGGQAVMEGVMMRGPYKTAVSVRKSDGEIVTKIDENGTIIDTENDMSWVDESIVVEDGFKNGEKVVGNFIPEDDFNAGMNDPVSLFLGWQANSAEREKPSGSRRLFNAALIKEACSYMGVLLSAIRAEKQKDPSTPIDVMAVVNKVVEDYYKNLPPMEPRQQSEAHTEAPAQAAAPCPSLSKAKLQFLALALG